MACFHPMSVWRTKGGDITFRPGHGVGFEIKIPCGQCVGCRLERSRQWAVRCMAEASLHADNCFITLTYSNENLPPGGGLRKSHFQYFIKKLRRANPSQNIRYFHCGEYGEENSRGHYHAIIFGFDFKDRRLYSTGKGCDTFTSDSLDDLWKLGFATVGDVSFESCAYVARYCMKKMTGNNARPMTSDGCPGHYTRLDVGTGEFIEVEPEYVTMSLKPAIGLPWLQRFQSDVYPSDQMVCRGKVFKPPRFFDKKYSENFPDEFECIKLDRVKSARVFVRHQSPERLAVRETVTKSRISTFSKRTLK